jgi:hypothetical protein
LFGYSEGDCPAANALLILNPSLKKKPSANFSKREIDIVAASKSTIKRE